VGAKSPHVHIDVVPAAVRVAAAAARGAVALDRGRGGAQGVLRVERRGRLALLPCTAAVYEVYVDHWGIVVLTRCEQDGAAAPPIGAWSARSRQLLAYVVARDVKIP
jgi:hypothetical protein